MSENTKQIKEEVITLAQQLVNDTKAENVARKLSTEVLYLKDNEEYPRKKALRIAEKALKCKHHEDYTKKLAEAIVSRKKKSRF